MTDGQLNLDHALRSAIAPAFECNGCGQSYFGQVAPVRCVRCGGSAFHDPGGLGDVDAEGFKLLLVCVNRLKMHLETAKRAIEQTGRKDLRKFLGDLVRVEDAIREAGERIGTVEDADLLVKVEPEYHTELLAMVREPECTIESTRLWLRDRGCVASRKDVEGFIRRNRKGSKVASGGG